MQSSSVVVLLEEIIREIDDSIEDVDEGFWVFGVEREGNCFVEVDGGGDVCVWCDLGGAVLGGYGDGESWSDECEGCEECCEDGLKLHFRGWLVVWSFEFGVVLKIGSKKMLKGCSEI